MNGTDMFCSDCGKEFAYDEKFLDVSQHLQSCDEDDSLTIHSAESVVNYCLACAQKRDFSNIVVPRK